MPFLLRLENVFSFGMSELREILIAALLRLDFYSPPRGAADLVPGSPCPPAQLAEKWPILYYHKVLGKAS